MWVFYQYNSDFKITSRNCSAMSSRCFPNISLKIALEIPLWMFRNSFGSSFYWSGKFFRNYLGNFSDIFFQYCFRNSKENSIGNIRDPGFPLSIDAGNASSCFRKLFCIFSGISSKEISLKFIQKYYQQEFHQILVWMSIFSKILPDFLQEILQSFIWNTWKFLQT